MKKFLKYLFKFLNFATCYSAALTVYWLGILLVKFLISTAEKPIADWLTYIMYFGSGVLLYYPIKFFLDEMEKISKKIDE
jgi:hypothetical protein